MSSEPTYYPVFLVASETIKDDFHSIYIDEQQSNDIGYQLAISKHLHLTLEFNSGPSKDPMYAMDPRWMRLEGWVEQNQMAALVASCRAYYQAPLRMGHDSQQWVAGALRLLIQQGILKPVDSSVKEEIHLLNYRPWRS
jgi:hypothetical protein